MYSDDELIVQLRTAFQVSTHAISTGRELPGAIRTQLARRRGARIAASGVAGMAVCGLAFGVATPGSNHHDKRTYPPLVVQPGTEGVSGPMKLASVSEVLDSASAARDPAVGPGRYLHTHTTSYGLSEVVGRRVIDVFATNIDDYWVPSDPQQVSLEKASYDDKVSYLSPEDRAYLQQNEPGGAPTRDVEWFATKGNNATVQVYPTFSTGPAKANLFLGSVGAGNPEIVGSGTQPGPATQPEPWTDPSTQNLLPRDPIALRASLYKYASAQEADARKAAKSYSADDAAFDAVAAALAWPNVTSALRSALYQVAKTIPGIKLVGSAANYIGAVGFAIGRVWHATGIEHDLIFDPGTGDYIGDRSTTVRATDQYPGTQGQPVLPAGTLISATAISVNVTGKPALPPGVKLP